MSAGTRSKRACAQEPQSPSTPVARESRREPAYLLQLPSDLLEHVLKALTYSELASLACACSQTLLAASDCRLWRAEWERVYCGGGPATALHVAAARAAGSWKALFAARHVALKAAEPWEQPSPWEVQASVDLLAAGSFAPAAPAAAPPGGAAEDAGGELGAQAPSSSSSAAAAAAAMMEAAAVEAAGEGAEAGEAGEAAAPAAGEETEGELCLCFLVDGSGSVTEEDFRVMTSFMATAVRRVAALHAGRGPGAARVAVVQFSNDVRVEQGPAAAEPEAFEALVAGLQRMNGGTNIALAVQKAGQLLKPLRVKRRVLALLTDGRIDSHQAREAHDMAARLADEQAGVSLHAYGVGRGVDREELLRIISARDPDTAEDRYMGLMTLDEAPW